MIEIKKVFFQTTREGVWWECRRRLLSPIRSEKSKKSGGLIGSNFPEKQKRRDRIKSHVFPCFTSLKQNRASSIIGANDGNRTHDRSLGSFCFAIKLHSQKINRRPTNFPGPSTVFIQLVAFFALYLAFFR